MKPMLPEDSDNGKVQNCAIYDAGEESALRRLIHSAFSKNPKEFSAELSLSYEFCQRVGQLHVPFRFSVRTLLPLLRISEDKNVVKFMASRLNLQVYELPEPTNGRTFGQLLSDFVIALSELYKVSVLAMGPGDELAVTELEARLDEIISDSVRLRELLRRRQTTPGEAAE